MELGWISINRKLLKHDVFKFSKVYSRFEAWVWLLLRANYEGRDVCIGNKIYKLKRGQMIISQLKVRMKFGWSNTRLTNFLNLLVHKGSIEYKTNTKMTIITILKYDSYQNQQYQKQTKTISKTNQKHINNNLNKDNKEINIKSNEFDKWWNLYDKKVGKAEALNYWLKNIKHSDLNQILNHTRIYVNQTEKQFRKDPIRYFRRETWKDEIIEKEKSFQDIEKERMVRNEKRIEKERLQMRAKMNQEVETATPEEIKQMLRINK